jgi:hypothetical protein
MRIINQRRYRDFLFLKKKLLYTDEQIQIAFGCTSYSELLNKLYSPYPSVSKVMSNILAPKDVQPFDKQNIKGARFHCKCIAAKNDKECKSISPVFYNLQHALYCKAKHYDGVEFSFDN